MRFALVECLLVFSAKLALQLRKFISDGTYTSKIPYMVQAVGPCARLCLLNSDWRKNRISGICNISFVHMHITGDVFGGTE